MSRLTANEFKNHKNIAHSTASLSDSVADSAQTDRKTRAANADLRHFVHGIRRPFPVPKVFGRQLEKRKNSCEPETYSGNLYRKDVIGHAGIVCTLITVRTGA